MDEFDMSQCLIGDVFSSASDNKLKIIRVGLTVHAWSYKNIQGFDTREEMFIPFICLQRDCVRLKLSKPLYCILAIHNSLNTNTDPFSNIAPVIAAGISSCCVKRLETNLDTN